MSIFTRTNQPPERARTPVENDEPLPDGAALTTVDEPMTSADVLGAGVLGAEAPGTDVQPDPAPRAWRRRARVATRWAINLAAAVIVMTALLAPDRLNYTTLTDMARIPVEALAGAALLLVLPPRLGRVLAVVGGLGLGLLNVAKVLDTGSYLVFARRFDPTVDWTLLGDGVNFIATTFNRWVAFGVVVAVLVVVPLGIITLTLSVLRMSRLVVEHRSVTSVLVAVLSLVWVASTALGVQLVSRRAFAARMAVGMARQEWNQVSASLKDQQKLAALAAVDRFEGVPGDQLLTGLGGKTVVLAFVESYGRSAVEDPRMAPQVDTLLDDGTRKLAAAGFAARSGWLTSPTYGGGSWLAHSTLLSGLWINSQGRYRQLMSTTNRLTLNKAFRSAGWRTVGVEPAIRKAWPEGLFYGYDKVYVDADLGYRGPTFGYATMPDQYIMSAFHRNEIAQQQTPVMAEVVLLSSHNPWAPLPKMVDWNAVGNGSLYAAIRAQGRSRARVWQSSDSVRAAYTQSIEYSLDTLISYLRTYGDDNTVLIFLGDHQPVSQVTDNKFGRDVPITVVAHDPSVLNRIAGWGWTPGLRPSASAPVWLMSDFRNRFLTAFGPHGGTTATTAPVRPASPTPSRQP